MTAPAGWSVATPRPAAASGPSDRRRMVVVDAARGAFSFEPLERLASLLDPGDLVVLNDAATLPASLWGIAPGGERVELRLARALGGPRWLVGVLGAGDWRVPTEDRGLPPLLARGDAVRVGDRGPDALWVHIERVLGPRLAEVRLEARDGWLSAIHRHGEPVRYSYLGSAVPLAAFQTGFAARPRASEPPSAGLPLSWRLLLGLRAAGIGLATVTHAAGLSSLDGGALDAALPLPERSDIPEATVAAVARARRVIAVGTTVVRALEGRVAAAGALSAGEAETDLVIGSSFRPSIVRGLLTKLHAPGESHFAVLAAFAPEALLAEAFEEAGRRGHLHHEFGDSALILP